MPAVAPAGGYGELHRRSDVGRRLGAPWCGVKWAALDSEDATPQLPGSMPAHQISRSYAYYYYAAGAATGRTVGSLRG